MYYSTEVTDNFNIEFIFIVLNRTQYPTRNNKGILMLNRDPDLYFSPGYAEHSQNWFEIRSKSNLPSKQTRDNYRIMK